MKIWKWLVKKFEDSCGQALGPGWYKVWEDVASIKFLLITKSIVRAGPSVLASQCHIKYDSDVNLTVIQSFKEINCLENNYQLVSRSFVKSYKWKDVHNEVTCFCLFSSRGAQSLTLITFLCLFWQIFLKSYRWPGEPVRRLGGDYQQQWHFWANFPVDWA